MDFKLSYKRFGSYSILVEWPSVINETILQDVLEFKIKIRNNSINKGAEITTAYNSLLINYYVNGIDFEKRIEALKTIYKFSKNKIEIKSRLWRIPVCYDGSFGIDLEAISIKNNISKEAIIKCHSQTIYTVYFIGFLPGFLYLGGLDKSISVPRKATPRLKVSKGAVAIGGDQTGVYPNASPGGWNIIGNSPIDFFDVSKTIPCFVSAGDKIEFYSVSLKRYHDIKVLVDAGVYIIDNVDI